MKSLYKVVGNLAFMEKTVTKSALSTVKTAHVTLKLEHVSVANLGGLESSVNKNAIMVHMVSIALNNVQDIAETVRLVIM